jgi:hypothetical protein
VYLALYGPKGSVISDHPYNADYVLAGSFADSAYFVTQMIRLCAHVGYPVDGRRHKTDGPVVASRVLSIQIADEGGPRRQTRMGCEPLKRRGLKRERLLTLRGSQDRRRTTVPARVLDTSALQRVLRQSPEAGFRPAWDPAGDGSRTIDV